MSRIGRKPITVPNGVDITVGEDNAVTVKGPKGELAHTVVDPITVEHLVNSWLKADGFPRETRRVPLDVAKFLGTALETIYQTLRIQSEPPVTRLGVEMLTTAQWFNTDAAKRDLGYTPTVSLAEGFVRLSQYLARERMSRRG